MSDIANLPLSWKATKSHGCQDANKCLVLLGGELRLSPVVSSGFWGSRARADDDTSILRTHMRRGARVHVGGGRGSRDDRVVSCLSPSRVSIP